MQSEEEFRKYMETAPVAKITNAAGDTTYLSNSQVQEAGLSGTVPAYAPRAIYKDENNKWTLTPNLSDERASIKMDENGKITVTTPDTWQDDEQIKKYLDDYMLQTLSGNYKMNKDVKYQDPYDETKQITTQEYIDKLNESIKARVSALDAISPVQAELIGRYGGTTSKNEVINSLGADDMIIMSANFDDDASWVPLPAYMLEAYPQLKDLETFSNGFVQKDDFLKNFYNIEDNKITERNAYGIATTPEKMLSEIEDMSPDEIARTIAFGNFISGVDPKRSNWQQFLQAGDALSKSFYGGFYDWWVGTADLIANIGNLSLIKGEGIETRDFWNGIIGSWAAGGERPGDITNATDENGGFDATAYMKSQMEYMAATNKDALSKAQAGYVQGRLAGEAIDLVVSLMAVGEASQLISAKITSKIIEKGSEKVAIGMAETDGISASTAIAPESEAWSEFLADVAKQNEAISKVASGSAKYRAFFSQTWSEAFTLYTKALGGTTAMLQSASPARLASIVNSAASVATAAKWANTAVNVLGSMVIAAVVNNKELTTKVLSSKATSDETKSWVNQVMWDTAKLGAVSWLSNVGSEAFGRWIESDGKFASAARQAGQKASQMTSKTFNKISHPWLSFMKWYLNNKAVASKVSNAAANAKATSAEALKEAVLANEMRAYGANLSTQSGSYGEKLIEKYLEATGVQRGVTMSETLENLARAGVVLDPATLNLSEFEAWQSDFVAAQNALTNWGDVSGNISQVVHEFTNPDIQPAISQQLTEINTANATLLDLEKEAGLLSKTEIKANKKLMKMEEGYIYAMHSPELSRYIVRSYELKVIENEARSKGVTDLENYTPYTEAKGRLEAAAKPLSEELKKAAADVYLPALARAEHNIVDVMVDDEVYSRSFVEAMRAGGKFGTNGADWIRLVAKRDLPKGTYNPFSRTVKEDNLIALNRFRILEDDQITWPGNGLQELINEYGVARAEKKLVDTAKAATGKTTEVVMSSAKTRSARIMKEFKGNFNDAVKKGFRSFTEDVEGTLAIGKKRTAEQKAYMKEVATTGGIETIDIDSLRAIMREKNLPMADDILDQESLDKFLAESTPEAKKLLLDVVGEKLITPELTEEGWGEAWKNFTPEVRKILRGELEKTSLQTGYGIKDTRARLNAQVPGFDVLDWSLLGREHTNGLVEGGLYAGMDNNDVKVYIMDLDTLRKLTGLTNTDSIERSKVKKITDHINTEGGGGIIPIHFSGESDFKPKLRWSHSGDHLDDWQAYFNFLESVKEITKVPVAIEDSRSSNFNSVFYGIRNSGIAQKGMDNIVDAINKAIATGKKPKFKARDISAALHLPGQTVYRLKRNIRSSIPPTIEDGASFFSNEDMEKLFYDAENYDWSADPELNANLDSIENGIKNKVGELPQDITADVKQAFSENAQIPFFRGQRGLGQFNMNDLSPTSQVGDAYWIAPNASYTDSYGTDKLAGTIPMKYFMSDKEKNQIVTDATAEASRILKKQYNFMKEKFLDTFKGSKYLNGFWFEQNWPEVISTGSKIELENKIFDSAKWLKKALTKKDRDSLDEIKKFLFVPSGRAFMTKIDMLPKFEIKSYRNLAEYAKKPVIDISEDDFAGGTAFFYYKDVSPEFDKEIGKQLETQAMGTKSTVWSEDDINDRMEKFYDGMSMADLIDNATSGQGFDEDFYDSLDLFEKGELSQGEISRIFDGYVASVRTSGHPGIAKVMEVTWENEPISSDLESMKFHYWHPSTGYTAIDDVDAEKFLEEMGEIPAQASEVTEEQITEWNKINPRNVDNVPTEPEFKQPNRVKYEDYAKGAAIDSGLTDTILNAIKDEQFNKLVEFKQKNAVKYEALINKVDRANAVVNPEVRSSQEIQVAADLFRQNIKDFENTTLFTDRFSYMAKTPAKPNGLADFAEKNKLELPNDKRPLKSKIKHALWQKIQNDETIPTIKGIKKSSISKNMDKKAFYEMLDKTELFRNSGGPNPLKYELDEATIMTDIDDAIDGLMDLIKSDPEANIAIQGMIEYQGYDMSPERYEFTVLDSLLSSEGRKEFGDTIKKLAHKIVDSSIPANQVIIKGNETALYNKVEKVIVDKLESRFAIDKAILESKGEKVDSKTVTELLKQYRSEIEEIDADDTIIKTTDENGEVQYERVSPALASIYNERPTYTPASKPVQILNNLAVLKKINTTDLSPRSFSKQAASDPAMAFATVGALPGTLQAMRDEIAYQFGPAALRAMEKNDPLRYANIQAIAAREGISETKALEKNLEALAKTQVPFTLLNRELLHQANVSKFGNEGAMALRRKNIHEKINAGLRKVSDVLGTPNNIRETYVRLAAGEKAFKTALRKGYSLEQAENFREYALNTATTNFRQKHTVFNLLRSTVPYLTSGISGMKSFWKMFELDPVGVTSRIFTGFIIPIIYFTGEILSDENLREKYKDLSESEKDNHIIISVGGELVRIPVGEELGQYTNIVMHVVETLHNENNYDFWNLMLNDLVNLLPGADLTGFTDPEMWEPMSGETPNFLEVMENGTAKFLSSTMPPIVQSVYMANTGRDLYTGKKINTSYITIDENGNAVIMSKSTSEFAKALAGVVGGDAKVIEKVVSGVGGTVTLHILDTLTSAAQFIGSGGKEGSLTTGVDKALSDLAAPYATYGYNSLERRFNSGVAALYDKKEQIVKSDEYIKYNQEIAKEKDASRRQTLVNKRNDLLTDFQNKVEGLVKGYRNAGGMLDKWKFSKVVSLLTFEDAIRANRQFMDINTNYDDAYKQAMQTLYAMGITNPDGDSSLGYIYTDKEGEPQLKMWTPAQIQIIQDSFYDQANIHAAKIKAIIEDGTENSLKKQRQAESKAEDPYWNKTKMTNADYDAIDDLRKEYNAKVVLALQDYMNTYGAANVLSNDAVIEYLNGIIRVPTAYETIKGRFVSSDNSKLNKQTGFAESYIKTIFGVRKNG